MHVAEVERGPLGAGGRGRGPGVACCGTSHSFGCCCECAAARVRPLRFTYIVILFLRRLNAHLSSIVSSKPFQMPVDVVSRTSASSGSRLSSFGFSGTIAHGSFSAQSMVPSQRSVSSVPASLYRSRHHLSRAQHIERLSVARGVGSDPLSTLAGRSAVYCKVQTISRPNSCKCLTQKTIQAQDHDEKSPPLNTIKLAMGSWKRLLGTARNVSRDFQQ